MNENFEYWAIWQHVLIFISAVIPGILSAFIIQIPIELALNKYD
jgi:hypothetical protein